MLVTSSMQCAMNTTAEVRHLYIGLVGPVLRAHAQGHSQDLPGLHHAKLPHLKLGCKNPNLNHTTNLSHLLETGPFMEPFCPPTPPTPFPLLSHPSELAIRPPDAKPPLFTDTVCFQHQYSPGA